MPTSGSRKAFRNGLIIAIRPDAITMRSMMRSRTRRAARGAGKKLAPGTLLPNSERPHHVDRDRQVNSSDWVLAADMSAIDIDRPVGASYAVKSRAATTRVGKSGVYMRSESCGRPCKSAARCGCTAQTLLQWVKKAQLIGSYLPQRNGNAR